VIGVSARTRTIIFSLFVALAGCSGKTAPNVTPQRSTLSGSVAGTSAFAVDSVSITAQGPNGAGLGILISNKPQICSWEFAPGQLKADSVIVDVVMVERAQGALPIGAGTYAISPFSEVMSAGRGTAGEFATSDGTCRQTSVTAIGGTLTLSDVSPTYVAGSFDLMFPNGDQVSATFTAPHCDFPASSNYDGGTKTCVP